MKGFDFDFPQQKNKEFLSKLKAERDRRFTTKKMQASVQLISDFYRQNRKFVAAADNCAMGFLSRTRDLRKLEAVVKEKYALMLEKALEKYQLMRVALLLNERNGEKHHELLANLCSFYGVLANKGVAINPDPAKTSVYRKRLILALIGLFLRGRLSPELSVFIEKTPFFFAEASVPAKLLLRLLKQTAFLPLPWARVASQLLTPWLRTPGTQRATLVAEVLTQRSGISKFLGPEMTSQVLETAIKEAKGLFEKRQADPLVLLENLRDLLERTPFFKDIGNEQMARFIDFMEVFTPILGSLTTRMSKIPEEDEKSMEIEPENPLPQAFSFATFFSGPILELVAEIFNSECKQNTPIFRLSELKAVRLMSRAYSLILSIDTLGKTGYLVAMSQTPIFLLKVFEIIEFFASFHDLKKNNLSPFSDILCFFSRIYLQKIELMDSAEFFSLELPNPLPGKATQPVLRNFPMEKVESLSLFLVNFAFRTFFIDSQQLDCKSAILELLNSLYFRHCQRNFAKNPKFWQIPEAAQISLATEASSKLLAEMPFVFPFETRVLRLKELMSLDQEMYKREDFMDLTSISVRRGSELEDAMSEFKAKKINWKEKLRVKYTNSQGIEEIGIDGGGMFKEFLTVVTRQACDPNRGLFVETPNHTLRPNPDSAVLVAHGDEQLYEFVGKLIGKAIYEDILIESLFERTFLKSVIGQTCEFNDLAGLEKEVYKSLLVLKHCESEEEVREMGMFFCVTEEGFGGVRTVELKPEGEKIPVTQ